MEHLLRVQIGVFSLFAVPYLALLAILTARVIRRSGASHKAGVMVSVILILSAPALFLKSTGLTLLLGTAPFDPWTIVANPMAVITIFACVLFAHARFSLRFASAPGDPVIFAAKWSLLTLGSWILFTSAAILVFELASRLTSGLQTYGADEGLVALFGLFAIPYLLVLAVLGGRVGERIGGSYQAGLTFVLTILLSIPALALYFALSMLILGQYPLD